MTERGKLKEGDARNENEISSQFGSRADKEEVRESKEVRLNEAQNWEQSVQLKSLACVSDKLSLTFENTPHIFYPYKARWCLMHVYLCTHDFSRSYRPVLDFLLL